MIHTNGVPPQGFTGLWRWKSESGWISHNTYSNGIRNGLCTDFYPSGAKWAETEVRGGTMEGQQCIWSKTGVKVQQANYHRGSFQGPICTWFPNGQIHIEGVFSNGNPVGLWVAHDQSARKRTEVLFGQAPRERGRFSTARDVQVRAWDEFGTLVLNKTIVDLEGDGKVTSITRDDLQKMDKDIPLSLGGGVP